MGACEKTGLTIKLCDFASFKLHINKMMRFATLIAIAIMALMVVGTFAQDSDPCYEMHHDESSCVADTTSGGGCVWCKCAALPSACFTRANAETLPPSVYDCGL